MVEPASQPFAPAIVGPLLSEMMFSWTTRDALKNNPANMVIAALDEQMPLSEDLRFRLQICLHEAIANALLHGNLDIHQGVENLDDLDARTKKIASQSDGRQGQRLLHVTTRQYAEHIEVLVKDQGTGINPDTSHDKHDKFGRGRELMATFAQSVVYDNPSTTLYLLFAIS